MAVLPTPARWCVFRTLGLQTGHVAEYYEREDDAVTDVSEMGRAAQAGNAQAARFAALLAVAAVAVALVLETSR